MAEEDVVASLGPPLHPLAENNWEGLANEICIQKGKSFFELQKEHRNSF